MKRLAFVIGVLTFGFVASTPARADFAVIKFESGYCQIWWDGGATPLGVGWKKIATAADITGAHAALDTAIAQRICL